MTPLPPTVDENHNQIQGDIHHHHHSTHHYHGENGNQNPCHRNHGHQNPQKGVPIALAESESGTSESSNLAKSSKSTNSVLSIDSISTDILLPINDSDLRRRNTVASAVIGGILNSSMNGILNLDSSMDPNGLLSPSMNPNDLLNPLTDSQNLHDLQNYQNPSISDEIKIFEIFEKLIQQRNARSFRFHPTEENGGGDRERSGTTNNDWDDKNAKTAKRRPHSNYNWISDQLAELLQEIHLKVLGQSKFL